MRIGVHLALGGGYEAALAHAQWLGCTCVQIFTHSPRMFAFKALDDARQRVLIAGWKRLGIDPVVSHASYLINIGAVDPKKYHGALTILKKEIEYAAAYGCSYVVLHVGKHVGSDLHTATSQIIKGLNALHSTFDGTGVMLLLETGAGQGTEIGANFEEINEILQRVDPAVGKHLGVCLDTCHLFAAGYDIRKPDEVINKIESTFGMSRIKVVHVNESKFGLGEHKDRHENLDAGKIGQAGMRAFLTHPKIRGLPMLLETPFEEEKEQKKDLDLLRKMVS